MEQYEGYDMKFVCVKEAPEELRKHEYTIDMPDFLEEVKSNQNHKGTTNVTRNKHLRSLVSAIGFAYGDETFNPYHVKIAPYEGLAFKDNEDLSKILIRLFNKEYPSIFNSYITKKIKERPVETKVIYFTGDFMQSRAFTEAGFELIKAKEVDVVLGLKKQRILGKPAVKDAPRPAETDNVQPCLGYNNIDNNVI